MIHLTGYNVHISIHVLRVEDDRHESFASDKRLISIHVLRVEDDLFFVMVA